MFELPIKEQATKTLTVKPNGRSADYTSPHFLLGCNSECLYCYVHRFQRKFIYKNINTDQILGIIHNHCKSLGPKIPNQCDPIHHTYDIGCDVDLLYHFKDYDWVKVFDFFNYSDLNIKATFATKYTHKILRDYKVRDERLRVRFSMLPKYMSDIVHGKVASIPTQLKWMEIAKNSGWDVHINLSPIIVYRDWLKDYDKLLMTIKENYNHPSLKFEVIFLTHHEGLHLSNLQNGFERAEHFMWVPSIQEEKISQYGGNNVRYKHQFKSELIKRFKEVFVKHFDEEQIRYIF